MVKGDFVSFDIEKSSGDHIMTLLQISQVIIEVGWNTTGKNRERKISPASQIICVKSIEPKPEYCPYTR
jgi:hypothetical protein